MAVPVIDEGSMMWTHDGLGDISYGKIESSVLESCAYA